jgi:hypothetical protein
MKLRFRHRALQAQQQPIVEIAGCIDAVGVSDQRRGQRAEIQQLMPITGGSRQSRHLEREDRADMAQADLGDELLERDP